MSAKINQADLKKLNKKVAMLKEYSKQGLANEVGKTAMEIVGRAKKSAPIDTGNLRQGISSEASGKGVAVLSKAEYSPYVEFGTGGMVDLNDMLELGIPSGYAAQFKGKGIKEVNLPARPFFFSSARVGFNNMLKRIEKQLKRMT
jgi:HK97 gp10 family phage protein